jgi:hypothetical protein
MAGRGGSAGARPLRAPDRQPRHPERLADPTAIARDLPVRLWLFGRVTLIEMHLLRLIREHYPAEGWRQQLSPARLEAAGRLLRQRQARHEAVDLADCLEFCDKRDLAAATPPSGLVWASRPSAAPSECSGKSSCCATASPTPRTWWPAHPGRP